MYYCVRVAQETTTSTTNYFVDTYSFEIKSIRPTNKDMKFYFDSCHKESEIHVVYPEQSTEFFENVVNITVNSASIIQ